MPTSLPNLLALELFVAVVDEGGLGAGARRTGMHQPNASRLMARLEAQAGRPLLERSPRGARPTAAGLVLAAQARELLAAAAAFTEQLEHGAASTSTELGIGASMTVAEHLVPAWIAELRHQQPTVRVIPHVLNSTGVVDQVREGVLPLGFIETPRRPTGLHSLTLGEDELVVVVAPGHPWVGRTDLDLAELAATPLVVRAGGSGAREAFAQLVPDVAHTPPEQVLGSNAAVRVAVASGAGPAVLSRLAVRAALLSGDLVEVPLRGHELHRPVRAVWGGPRRLSGASAALVDVARRSAATVLDPAPER